jgi:large subunit ribosomal protein L32
MPPLPKKKHSTSRKQRKRAHISMATASLVVCPQCRSPRPSHQVCKVCGTYRGNDILSVGIERKRPKSLP